MTLARVAVSAAALLVALCAGMWLGGHPHRIPEPLRDPFVAESAGLTAEAGGLIEDNYFRAVDPDRLVDASLRGIVRELRRRHDDRFSQYLSPRALAHFNEAISGRFSGIGLSVTEVPRGLRAARVFRGTPAERADIAVGDVIVSVNGRPIRGMSSTRATNLIKGPEGTRVRIGVLRPGTGELRRLALTRAEVRLPVATSDIRRVGGRRVGYVIFSAFTQGSHGLLRQAIERTRRRGAEALVLDLRGNGGGLLQEAVLAASVFIPEGETVVSTRSRTQGRVVYEAVGGELPAQPLAVLIDRSTASAGEILAASLADHLDAPIVGTRSFGKGSFQQELPLSNGGALKLTVGEYFTPSGVNLAGRGVHPDVSASDRPATPRDEVVGRALGAVVEELERRGRAGP